MKIYKLAASFGQEDYMNIGSTPPEESCARIGSEMNAGRDMEEDDEEPVGAEPEGLPLEKQRDIEENFGAGARAPRFNPLAFNLKRNVSSKKG